MDENVGTLEIPMEDSFLVEMVECCDDVGGEIPNADFVDFAEILFGVVDELMQVTSIWVVRELPANYITMQRTWSLSSKKASLQATMQGHSKEASILISLRAFCFYFEVRLFNFTFFNAQILWSLNLRTLYTVLNVPSPSFDNGTKSRMELIIFKYYCNTVLPNCTHPNHSSSLPCLFLLIIQLLYLNTMIVKNRQEPAFAPPKPYFLQGLEHARQILLQLKKHKEQDLQYSPITRKHTKLSSDAIIEEESQHQYEPEPQQRNQTLGKKNEKAEAGKGKISKHKKMRTQSYEEHENEAESMQTTKYKPNEGSMAGEDNEDTSLLQKQLPNCTNLHKQIQESQLKINEIGNKLQSANSQIQTCEVIFENLCDCYRANQHIYSRNYKLRREAIRLEQDKIEILAKIDQLANEAQLIDQAEKQAHDFLVKTVRNHVKDLCAFNQDIRINQVGTEDGSIGSIEDSEPEEETYETKVKLGYRKLKQKHEEKTKKKAVGEPKKLQKGVSFEEEIDVMSKYYESQLSNI